MNSKLCYVTAFYDIGRGDWTSFQRNIDTYLEHFSPFVQMIENSEHEMRIFIDSRHADPVKKLTEKVSRIQITKIDSDFLNAKIPIWGRLPRETEIMASVEYKNLMQHRLRFPEHNNPRYTLINHAKIDFVCLAMQLTDCEYFCWVDFGYFQNKDRIPRAPLDISLLDQERVNYTLINQLDEHDRDIMYTLHNAPERIGGFFFFGNKKSLTEYQNLFHTMLDVFQTLNIADDDQHIALRCYYTKPELFKLHFLGGWHRALVHFQKAV